LEGTAVSSARTFPATPRRIRQARREGRFARSVALSSAAVGTTVAAALWVGGAWMIEGFAAWLRRSLSLEASTVSEAWAEAGWQWGRMAGPLLGVLCLGALAAACSQAGLHFVAEHTAPKLDRVSPGAGLARMFQLRNVAELGRGGLLVLAVGAMAWLGAEALLSDSLQVITHGLGGGATAWFRPLSGFGLSLAAGALALAGLDYAWARWSHLRSLRMTFDEVRREHRESEGDPMLRARRRAEHRSLMAQGAARGARAATVLVVNPTHVAVALRYDSKECDAPYLVAKGREDDALALRREAQRAGVPIVRDIPLARSLVHYDVGEAIPEELYEAAAAVLRVAADSSKRGAR
jgi:type III secretion protein U